VTTMHPPYPSRLFCVCAVIIQRGIVTRMFMHNLVACASIRQKLFNGLQIFHHPIFVGCDVFCTVDLEQLDGRRPLGNDRL